MFEKDYPAPPGNWVYEIDQLKDALVYQAKIIQSMSRSISKLRKALGMLQYDLEQGVYNKEEGFDDGISDRG